MSDHRTIGRSGLAGSKFGITPMDITPTPTQGLPGCRILCQAGYHAVYRKETKSCF